MGYQWVTEWNGYNLSYGTGSADSFHNDPNRSFNYVGNTPLTGYVTIGENKTWTISEGNSIHFLFNSSSSWSGVAYYNGGNIGSINFTGNGYNRTDLLMMVDETNERCAMYEICYRANDGLSFIFTITNNAVQEHNAYLLYQLGNVPPIVYTWQSVPSISGKNGILSLVTLDSESINDGEPVSGAAVSVFDQNPVSGNNVKDIVDGNTPLIPSAVDVTATFIISNPPVGELASRILAAKKDSIPESIEDADKTVSIPANASNVTMPGLDENSQYYFAIFVADATGDTAVSDPKDIYTSADEGWLFDYTGEIQTFVAPKTGIYQLETWGAQGGDATDGTLTARGGYGAYAVGEVFLTQGDTLYINVGGQNGYGGGGNFIPPELEYIKNVNNLKLYRSNTFFEVKEQTECWGDNSTHTTAFDASSKTSVAINNADYTLFHTEAGVAQASDSTETYCFALASILSINLVKGSGTSYTAEYSTVEDGNFFTDSSFYNQSSLRFVIDKYTRFNYRPYTASRPTFRTSFTDLTDAIEYIYANFAYINLYVDGALWVEA